MEVRAGQLIPLKRVRTRGKTRDSLVALVEALGPLERLAVLHANCLEGAQELAARLAPRTVGAARHH